MVINEENKSKKVQKIPKTQPIFSFYSDVIVTRWSDDKIILEFAQEPKLDNGFLTSCRIYIDPNFIKGVIEGLTNTKKDYEKRYGKIKK